MTTTIKTFFDTRTSTMTYVVYDPETRDALIIDPVLDYEPESSKAWTESVDEVIAFVRDNKLKPLYVLETHAHADHLSGSQMLSIAFPKIKLAIGERIKDVQKTFKVVFVLPQEFSTDGRQFDHLLSDNEEFKAGSIVIKAIATPGHTPACMSFLIDDALFAGDVILMPDSGSGRCDFPSGSADDMYASVQRLYREFPDETKVYIGHDYQPNGRGVEFQTTIGEEKVGNIAIDASRGKEDFIAWRESRDQSLDAPRLIFQSVQVNVDGGKLPAPHENQTRYLKIPINAFRPPAASENPVRLIDGV